MLQEQLRQLTAAKASAEQKLQAQLHEVMVAKDTAEQTFQTLAESVRASHHKLLAKPPRFSGDDQAEVEDWLFAILQYIQDMPTSPAGKIRVAASFFDGSAALWWRSLNQEYPTPEVFPCRTWETFSAHVRENFKATDSVRNARDELAALQQTTTVRDYIKEFRRVTIQIHGISHDEKLDRFVRGLKAEVRKVVITGNVKTLEEHMELAARQDNNLQWSRRLQHQQYPRYAPRPPAPQPAMARPAPGAAGPMPMDVDAMHLAPITDEEREHLRRIRGCFRCRKPGHTQYYCPQGNGPQQ